MRRYAIVLIALTLLAASPGAGNATDARILAIGDSLMAWHRGAGSSIADIVSKELAEPVENRSISGARVIYGLPITGALGMRISRQYRDDEDNFDWVIITGGGNDLWLGCGCSRCERRMTRMISPDAKRGELVDLVGRIRRQGARVVYLGYLRSPGTNSPIESCKDEAEAFEARLATFAERDRGVYFHSIAGLVPSGDRSFHGVDMIHPSHKASTIIGQQIARIIKRADSTR